MNSAPDLACRRRRFDSQNATKRWKEIAVVLVKIFESNILWILQISIPALHSMKVMVDRRGSFVWRKSKTEDRSRGTLYYCNSATFVQLIGINSPRWIIQCW